MDITIIIVNYNTKLDTEKTILSVIEKTKYLKYEIILVDNNSNDGSKEYFKKYKQIKYIQNEKNIGFGKANNLALKYATGKYLFFLNPDTLLIENEIYKLYQYMEENIHVGICGGNLYSLDNKEMHSFGKELPSIKIEFLNIFDLKNRAKKLIWKRRVDFNYGSQPLEVGYITGADLMIRKEIFEEMNGFDPDFFMYYEETELTKRVKEKGYKVCSLPWVNIIHLEGNSCKFKNIRTNMFLESKYLYFKKVYGKKVLKQLYILNFIEYFLKGILTLDFNWFKGIKINREKFLKYKD